MRVGQVVEKAGFKVIRLVPWFQFWGSKKYTTILDYHAYTPISGFNCIHSDKSGTIALKQNGQIYISKDFLHDGPSGPTYDTKNTLRAAGEHDALFRLMKNGALPFKMVKKVNEFFEKRLIEDGMNRFRARLWRLGVDTPIAIRSARPIK